MNILKLSFKNVMHKRTLTFLTVFAVAFATALVVFIFLVNDGLQKNVGKGYGPFHVVVGAEGSASQLVLNTFYHLGAPTGNVSYELYEDIKESRFVEKAIPMTRGDNYKGFAIVGTPFEYLSTRYPDASLQKGTFYQVPGEVVIGSYVADILGLKIGDSFHGNHGAVESGDSHDDFSFKVVGILGDLGTPDDKAIFTTLNTAWVVHDDHGTEDVHLEDEEHAVEEGHEEHTVEEDHEEHIEGDITAIVIKPKGVMDIQGIKANYDELDGVQVAYSGKTTAEILTIVDTGAKVIKLLALVTILIAAISVLLSLSAMASERKKDIGLLRLIGKSKAYITFGMIIEANLLTLIGIIIGLSLGHIGSYMLTDIIFSYSGIQINAWTFISAEIYIILGGIIICTIAALIPSLRSYRIDPVQLFHS